MVETAFVQPDKKRMQPSAAGNHNGSEDARPPMAFSEAASYPANDDNLRNTPALDRRSSTLTHDEEVVTSNGILVEGNDSAQFRAGLPVTADDGDSRESYTYQVPKDSPTFEQVSSLAAHSMKGVTSNNVYGDDNNRKRKRRYLPDGGFQQSSCYARPCVSAKSIDDMMIAQEESEVQDSRTTSASSTNFDNCQPPQTNTVGWPGQPSSFHRRDHVFESEGRNNSAFEIFRPPADDLYTHAGRDNLASFVRPESLVGAGDRYGDDVGPMASGTLREVKAIWPQPFNDDVNYRHENTDDGEWAGNATSGFPLQSAPPAFPEGGTRSDPYVSPGREQEDTFETAADSADVAASYDHRDSNVANSAPPALHGMERVERPRTRRMACACPNCVSGEGNVVTSANGVRKKLHNCHIPGKLLLTFKFIHNRFKQYQSTRRGHCTSNPRW